MTNPIPYQETPAMLYSITEFEPLLRPLLFKPQIRSVCEIGAENGGFSEILWHHVEVGILSHTTIIEPEPKDKIIELCQDPRMILCEGPSLSALADLRSHDLYILDGDHNYHTVLNELRLIYASNRHAIVIAHDVGWPCGRRDQYYSPSCLPAHAVRPHSFDIAISPGQSGAAPHGMISAGAYATALEEGGKENGVLTAIEDFITERQGHTFFSIPIFHGLAVIHPADHPLGSWLYETMVPNPAWMQILRRLEDNRLRNWLGLIELGQRLAVVTQNMHRSNGEVP
ncbi:MAG: class I SAM-dependent methyltransferase [Proteobacteria bacterium]|nr:class I SAM-dependent methyltransferase [Pseudomonadota bacterium]